MNRLSLFIKPLTFVLASVLILNCKDDSSSSSTSSAPRAEGSSVTLSGEIQVQSSGSSSLNLTQSLDQYWLKCVSTDLNDPAVCTTQLNSSGEFNMDCGFSGKAFGCFILEGTDTSNLQIIGTLSSTQLVIGGSATNANLIIVFDPDSGVASIGLFRQLDGSGGSVSGGEQELSDELVDLEVKSGEHGFCLQDLTRDEADDILQRDGQNDADFSDCDGDVQSMYVHFTKAEQSASLSLTQDQQKPPYFEVWQSKQDRDNCIQDDGSILYHISDGSRELEIEDDGAVFSDLFDLVVDADNDGDNPWIPEFIIDGLDGKGLELRQDGDDEEEISILFDVYGTEGVCAAFADDLIDAYDAADYPGNGPSPKCGTIDFEASITPQSDSHAEDKDTLERIINDGKGPPPEWCELYRNDALNGDADAERRKNSFISECIFHLENGDEGKDLELRQAAVWLFLNALAEQRRDGDESTRYAPIVDAIQELLDLNVDLEDLPTTCDNGPIDEALAFLIETWLEVDFPERAYWLDQAINEGDLDCDPISFPPFGPANQAVGLSQDADVSFDNGRFLLKELLDKTFSEVIGRSPFPNENTGFEDLVLFAESSSGSELDDDGFQESLNDIRRHSRCLPDASISRKPILVDGGLDFEINLGSPVKRLFAGEVRQSLNLSGTVTTAALVAEGDPKFEVHESRMLVDEGGVGSEPCVVADVKRFERIEFDTEDDSFKGIFTRSFRDTCIEDFDKNDGAIGRVRGDNQNQQGNRNREPILQRGGGQGTPPPNDSNDGDDEDKPSRIVQAVHAKLEPANRFQQP